MKDEKEVIKEVKIADMLIRFAEQYRVELYDNLPNSDIQGVAQVDAQLIIELLK